MELEDKQRDHKRRKVEDEQQTTGMEILPREIVLDIFSRLPISSLVQFKFVCRAWRTLAQDPLLAIANLHITSKAEKNPCLILHSDFPIRNQLSFIDLSMSHKDNKVRKFQIPFHAKMPEFDAVGSCNGLLCLSDSLYNDALYVYNPFTRDYLELPKSMQYLDQEVVFGFGFHPTTKEYKVIKIIYYRKNCSNFQRARRIIYPRSDVQVYTVGTPAWRSLGKLTYQFVRRPSEALVNGRLHWVTRPKRYSPARRIVSFDIADEQFREVPKPDCGSLDRCNDHLAVLRGCLSAAVYGNYAKLEIWVMKDYNVKESWIKQFNIGAYIPKGLKHNLDRPLKIWKNASNGRVVRFVCILEKGEILLEYKSRALVSYDPKRGIFKDLVVKGIPNWFQTIVHQGSLNWIDTPQDM
ncbi:F-box protein [Melia azedarach]|uniref:F-box protein n=1 Tax=Melia azedarach TaxID=155640 RepID=A0ACC1Z333_MELAZ|nr:F-box protein [Melia azedarach]